MGSNFLNATLTYVKLLIIGRITNNEALLNNGGEQRFISSLKIGNNFVVVAKPNNYERDNFFIVQCLKKLHIVAEDSRPDDFGNYVEKGDEVVIGQ